MVDSAEVMVAVAVLLAVSLTGAAAGVPGAPGIAPGLHRRLDGAGFSSPQEDDFFADYKDLVTPPKDLLETPKDLLDTPKDLTETPEDLVDSPKDLTETPKNLLDDEDLEEYAQHGSAGAQQEEEVEVDSTHPSEDDTALHDKSAERSLAKHLKGLGSTEYDHDAPAKTEYFVKEEPDKTEYYVKEEPDKTEYYGHDAPGKTAYFGPPKALYNHASPYDQAVVRPPYSAPAKTTFKKYKSYKPTPSRDSSYTAPSAALRTGYSSSGLGDGRAARPEYAYRYGVHDPTTRDVKSAWEQRDGDATRGGYAVMEPDGHTRVVEYSVTKKGGFNARVKHLPPGHHSR